MAERMRRTQIYLEPDLSAALDRLARKNRTTRAALVRQAARRLVDEERGGGNEEDPIWSIVGIGHGPPDGRGGKDHDEILNELVRDQMRKYEHRKRQS